MPNIIAAVGTSLDNCSNPKRTAKHRDDPKPNRKPRFMSAQLATFKPLKNAAAKRVVLRDELFFGACHQTKILLAECADSLRIGCYRMLRG
jgi:hypothetical protein